VDTGSLPPRQTPDDLDAPTSERRSTPPGSPGPTTRPGVDPYVTRPAASPAPKKSRTWIWVLLVAILIIAGVWWLTHRGGDAAPAGGAAAGGHGGGRHGGMSGIPTTVSVAQAKKGDMPIYLNELGAVTPLATVTIQSQIAGYLQSIDFKEGQMVKKGQLLAQIDPRPYQAALLQAQGALARDEATLGEAQLDLKRYQLLLSQDSIARQQVDIQAATVKQDEGTVKVDQAAVVTAKLNLTYTHIVSPVTGRVGLRQVDIGTYVTSGLTNGIVVVTQLTPIDVQFTLPEDNLPAVVARVHAGATLPAVATDRTATIELAKGSLLTLDNQVDPTTGTVKAKARFDNGAGNLFPQQFVNIRLLVDSLKNSVIVPTSAVLRGPDGLFVYVVKGGVNNHTVTVRAVKTGPAAGELTAVTDGLQLGETVVTDGTDRLNEGSKVILPGDCIPTMGPPGGKGGHGHGGHGAAAGPGGGHSGGGCPAGSQREPQPARTASTNTAGDADAVDAGQGTGVGSGGHVQALLAQLNLDPAQQLKAQAIFTRAQGQAMTAAGNAGDDMAAAHQARQQAFNQAFDELAPLLRPDQKAQLAAIRAKMAAREQTRTVDHKVVTTTTTAPAGGAH
jgi:multidrug efflux system membrane fusion protein